MLEITLRTVTQTLLGGDVGAAATDIGASLSDALYHFVRQNLSTFNVPTWLPTPSNRRIDAPLGGWTRWWQTSSRAAPPILSVAAKCSISCWRRAPLTGSLSQASMCATR